MDDKSVEGVPENTVYNNGASAVADAPNAGAAGVVDAVSNVSSMDTAISKSQKKKWIIIFSILGVVIVGLIIAIVVVAVNNGGKKDANEATTEEALAAEELWDTYEEASGNVLSKLVDEEVNLTMDEILALYQEEIQKATDGKVRAMLILDYYGMVTVADVEKTRGEEAIKAAIEADEIVQTLYSAGLVISIAEYYEDQETIGRYTEITNERWNMLPPDTGADNGVDEETSEEDLESGEDAE